jgi:hypothetical protein
MHTQTYRVTAMFWEDHCQRDCAEVGTQVEERRNSVYAYVTLDAEGYKDLLGDADYYADMVGDREFIDPEYHGLCRSAAVTKRLLKSEGPPQPPTTGLSELLRI